MKYDLVSALLLLIPSLYLAWGIFGFIGRRAEEKQEESIRRMEEHGRGLRLHALRAGIELGIPYDYDYDIDHEYESPSWRLNKQELAESFNRPFGRTS
jgi:hypothetical protein